MKRLEFHFQSHSIVLLASWYQVIEGPISGLVIADNKQLHKPILTEISEVIWHNQAALSSVYELTTNKN